MTINQILHHKEQMEAMRQEFQKLWLGPISEQLLFLKAPVSDYPKYEQIAWMAFREGKKQS